MDETEWIEYIDKYVLVKDVVGPGRWSVGDASQGSSRPGATTSTAGQAIESWWAGLKRILPVNIGLMSCSNATHELEKALKAKYTQAGLCVDNSIVDTRDHFQCYPATCSSTLVFEGFGERDDDGVPHRCPSMQSYVRHAPRNYMRSGTSTFCPSRTWSGFTSSRARTPPWP